MSKDFNKSPILLPPSPPPPFPPLPAPPLPFPFLPAFFPAFLLFGVTGLALRGRGESLGLLVCAVDSIEGERAG